MNDLCLLTALAVDLPNISKLFSPLTVVKFYTWTRIILEIIFIYSRVVFLEYHEFYFSENYKVDTQNFIDYKKYYFNVLGFHAIQPKILKKPLFDLFNF